jgi:hypothetical protein
LHVGFIQVQFGPASGAATRVGRQTFRGSMAASGRPDREAASSASGPGTRVVALAQRYRCSGAPGAPDDPSPRRGCRPPVRAVVGVRGPRDRALVMPVANAEAVATIKTKVQGRAGNLRGILARRARTARLASGPTRSMERV